MLIMRGMVKEYRCILMGISMMVAGQKTRGSGDPSCFLPEEDILTALSSMMKLMQTQVGILKTIIIRYSRLWTLRMRKELKIRAN